MTSRNVRTNLGSARLTMAIMTVGALLLAACGGGGDNGGGPAGLLGSTTTRGGAAATTTTAGDSTDTTAESTDSTEGSSTATSGPADPEDLALARSAALTAADFPDGWTMDSEDDSGGGFGNTDDPEFEKACPDVYSEVKAIEAGGGTSAGVDRSFSPEGGMPTAQSSVMVFGSEEDTARAFAAIAGDAFAQCIADVFTGGAMSESGIDVGDVSTRKIPVDAGSLDGGGGYAMEIPLTQGGSVMTMRLSVVALHSGRILHMVMVMSMDPSAPFSGLQDVIKAAVARTEAA